MRIATASGASVDGGVVEGSNDAGSVGAVPDGGVLGASRLNCGPYTDIATALVGMHPDRVWLTRVEMDLPREALSQDCVVTAVSPTAVSNQLAASKADNAPCPLASADPERAGSAFQWAGGAFAAFALARRRRRR